MKMTAPLKPTLQTHFGMWPYQFPRYTRGSKALQISISHFPQCVAKHQASSSSPSFVFITFYTFSLIIEKYTQPAVKSTSRVNLLCNVTMHSNKKGMFQHAVKFAKEKYCLPSIFHNSFYNAKKKRTPPPFPVNSKSKRNCHHRLNKFERKSL